jgi:hypothetical protein
LLSRSLVASVLVAALGCGGDDSEGTATETSPTTTAPTTTTVDPTSSSSTIDPSDTSATDPSESSSTSIDPSTGPVDTSGDPSESSGGPACDPVVPGQWNSCINDMGAIDNTLCMWMGTGKSVGMVSCLNAASDPDANTCFIRGCKDTCDCFAPPATGTAPVVCDSIIDGGEFGCALSCANGETCPDGMTCLDNLCFWPAAE